MIERRQTTKGMTYRVRVYRGQGRYEWIGAYPTLKAARHAEAQALTQAKRTERMTCGVYVDRYLAEYEQRAKDSSYDTAKGRLKRFRHDFEYRPVDQVTRIEAKDWAAKVPDSCVPSVVTLFNQAVEDELIERNPFRERIAAAVAESARIILTTLPEPNPEAVTLWVCPECGSLGLEEVCSSHRACYSQLEHRTRVVRRKPITYIPAGRSTEEEQKVCATCGGERAKPRWISEKVPGVPSDICVRESTCSDDFHSPGRSTE